MREEELEHSKEISGSGSLNTWTLGFILKSIFLIDCTESRHKFNRISSSKETTRRVEEAICPDGNAFLGIPS